MKDVDCPFGIFLDLYVLDNVADNPVLYQIQSWTAWFWSKLMILRAIPRPTLQQRGIKAKIIWTVCGMVYKAMKLLHISPQWLRMRCERVCRKYNKYRTRRMAFLRTQAHTGMSWIGRAVIRSGSWNLRADA